MCCATTKDILPEPPEELKQLSAKLANRIQKRINREGSIPFSEYMEMALYEPGLGYYAAGLKKFGQGGDFVTAPQLGDVFAQCLARQIEQIGIELDHYDIIEAAGYWQRICSRTCRKPIHHHITGYLSAVRICARFKKKPLSCRYLNGWTESAGLMSHLRKAGRVFFWPTRFSMR